ncbi:MAG: Ig-like domain-containing protein [Promethearchaeota archaeon]
MNKKILLVIMLLIFSLFLFPAQHTISSENTARSDSDDSKIESNIDDDSKTETTIDEPNTPKLILSAEDLEEFYEESFETVEEWKPYDIPPHNISYNGTVTNHLALDSNTTQTEDLNITITNPLNGTILKTKYVNATWNTIGDFDYFGIELDNVTKGNTTDTFYYLEIPEGWHTLKITGYSGNLSTFDSVIFDPVLGGGSYELRLHIIEDETKEDYSYCWVKLANEHWNNTAYGQADVNGEIVFTEVSAGDYYVEIYPPSPSSVFGTRVYCTNVSINSNLNLGIEVYDYRGHIALAWGHISGITNMTQYIIERMEGVGAQKGDIIQLNLGHNFPDMTTDISGELIANQWGKNTLKDVIIGLKQAGYRIWISPRLTYCEYYPFWQNLDDYSDLGYADGDYYNEGGGSKNYKSYNAFQQFEARLTTIKNTTHTGDTKKTFSVGWSDSVSICLKQEDYWDVYDVTDSTYLSYGTGSEQWSFDNATATLTIHKATKNHVYEIYYLGGSAVLGSPVSNYNNDPYFLRTNMLEHMRWWYENCTLSSGECAIDGFHPNYFGSHSLGSWDKWQMAWCGLTTKVMIDWFLGNYTQYADDFKLSWITFEGTASEFANGRNDSLPFMHDWLYFREKLLHEEWFKPFIEQAARYNVSVIMYDGDDNRLFSSEWAIRLGADMMEHQSGTGVAQDTDNYHENYADYWSTRVPFVWDIEETWQDEYDHEGFRTQLMRTSALGCLPSVMYNHGSPYNYHIPEDRYAEYLEAHNDFKEVWKTHKQFQEWKIAKVYVMVGVVSRQSTWWYGYADPSWITPKLYQMEFLYRLPVQIDFISTYFIEENGIPDDCDLLIIGGQHSDYPYTTYHSLYSDTLNSTLTTYVNGGGAIWFMGDVGRYATNGTNLSTGYWEKLANIQCVNYSWYLTADIFYVNESHWIINDEMGHGIIDNCEGWGCADPDIIGEPEDRGLHTSYVAIGMFNITSYANSNDVVIWYGNSTHKLPYLYIRDDIGSGYVAYCPAEKIDGSSPMGGRLYETLKRTVYYLMGMTDHINHVNVTLENYFPPPKDQFTKEKFMWYTTYNNSYSWLIGLMYDQIKSNYDLRFSGNTFTTWVNLSDFMDVGSNYLIYCFDRSNSSWVGSYNHIWDGNELVTTNRTLLSDNSGDHLFQKGERFEFTFERDIVHWFIIKEAVNINFSLIQVRSTNNIIHITNEKAVGNVYLINATANTGTETEFIVYCNFTISSIIINGASVPFYHNLTTKILNFNHTFASSANIEIKAGPDTTLPSISSPVDLNYETGYTGNEITWTITESYPVKYNVTRDDILVQSGSYRNRVAINVDGLSIGTYVYVIGVNDTSGNSASDTVIVTVTPDYTAPSITSPSDVSYEVGDTGTTIMWTITEPNADRYNITRDGIVVQSGPYTSGISILIDVDGLSIGSYTYKIGANDTFGNYATDMVIVTITADFTAPSVSSPSDVSYEEGSTGNEITWTITDSNPDKYNVTRNGIVVQSGLYASGVLILINIDGLSIGSYTYKIGANDTFGNYATDIVIVKIVKSSQDDDEGGSGGGGQNEENIGIKAIIDFSKTSVYQGEQIHARINVTTDVNELINDALVKLEILDETFYCYLTEDGVYAYIIDTSDYDPGIYEIKIIIEKDGFSSYEEIKSIEIKDWFIPSVLDPKSIQSYLSDHFLSIRVAIFSLILAICIWIIYTKKSVTQTHRN